MRLRLESVEFSSSRPWGLGVRGVLGSGAKSLTYGVYSAFRSRRESGGVILLVSSNNYGRGYYEVGSGLDEGF